MGTLVGTGSLERNLPYAYINKNREKKFNLHPNQKRIENIVFSLMSKTK